MTKIDVTKEFYNAMARTNEKAKEAIKSGDLVQFNYLTNSLYNRVDNFCMSLGISKDIANQIIGELSRQYIEVIG